MSNVYDNWERLVAAVIKKQQLWKLFHEQSRSPSICSEASESSSSFSYPFQEDGPFGDDFSHPFQEDIPFGEEVQGNISNDVNKEASKDERSSRIAPRKTGMEMAVKVLDTLGSRMTNLVYGGFTTSVVYKRNKVSILAFEVANTIAKGANLLQSMSKQNVQILRNDILHSEGVKQFVSEDMNQLLSIAAADKREELDIVFSREVIRFGNMCKDPQWHNLDRFFSKFDSYSNIHKQLRKKTEMTMRELTTLAQHTYELYHELHALDRFEQDYLLKIEEVDSLHLPRKGESLAMLISEIKRKSKIVRSLKKKSLWSKSLEKVVEKLVDIVYFIHQAISEAFGDNGLRAAAKVATNKPERLGLAGLSLHYANIITQIDEIASQPTSLPLPNTRNTLYNGLPAAVKTAIRSRLMTVDAKKELTVPQIKAEMERTLEWLVPVATNTIAAHQSFGWVREWANNGNEFGEKTNTTNSDIVIRLQTLYHADKQKVESCILDLVFWLHHLISLVRYRDNGRNLIRNESLSQIPEIDKLELSREDINLSEDVMKRMTFSLGLGKGQELVNVKMRRNNKIWALSQSSGSSSSQRGLKHLKDDVLDILDGLDSSFRIPRDGDII